MKDIATRPGMESSVDLRLDLAAGPLAETPLLVISSAGPQSCNLEQGYPPYGFIRKLSLLPVSTQYDPDFLGPIKMIRTSSVPNLLTTAGTSRPRLAACQQRIPGASSSGSDLLVAEAEVPVRLTV